MLPFENQNRDPATDYLSDGIPESIINSLSELPKLKVMSRNSVFHYKGKETDAPTVGKELKVQTLLTGQVRQRGDDLTIGVELINAQENRQMWGQQYNRKLSDLFAMQEEIAKEVSEKLRLKLTGAEQEQMAKRPTENLKAFQYYMQGRAYAQRSTREDLLTAIQYCEKALKEDRNYALAWAGLAQTYVDLGVRGYIAPIEGRRNAEEAARKALALDDNLAEGHAALGQGYVAYVPSNFSLGDRELRRAIELQPSLALAHFYLGISLVRQGAREQGLAEFLNARELDPLSSLIARAVALPYYFKRDYKRALELLQQANELGPAFSTQWEIGVYLQNRLFNETLAQLEKARRERKDDPILIYSTGMVYAAQGKRAEALRIVKELEEMSGASLSEAHRIARIYAVLNERDLALTWLERGLAAGAVAVFYRDEPVWDPIREDPRFKALVEKNVCSRGGAMIEPEGIPRSRRTFIKGVLAGTAGTLMTGVDKRAAHAGTGARQRGELSQLSLSEISQLVRGKKASPVELTQECLSRIEQLNPKLNAFITVTADSALAEARRAETEIQHNGWKGPLHGIPIALKDLADTAGVRTTAGSGLFKDRIPTQDAEIVRRLKTAGAVLLGKLNMHEFAYGGSSVISYFGPVHNPWNLDYSSGGSSGGSAAAVAAQLCYGAIGSDTGGSIRQPAAYCGIVGLKPSYGRVSTSGVIPLSWSLDHIGPITRSAKDAALMLQVIAGYDAQDTASLDLPVPDYAATNAAATSSLRLGIPRAYFYETLHPEIEAAMAAALSVLKTLTRNQRDIAPLAADSTYSSMMDPCFTILRAEAYAYHKEYVSKSPELYQAQTLKRIQAGADIPTSAYIQARRQLELVRRSVARVFETTDLLITPTACVPPFAIADLLDPNTLREKELLMLRNTRPFNMLGLPTISVPCGFTRTELPIGMQITGPPGSEATVLRVAYAYEQATEWHKRKPNLD